MGKIGYIRVSTEHQETARQEALMKQYQVERVFAEKMSGKNADRPELKAMLEYVREGDTLYIESISRLGRSTRDLLNKVVHSKRLSEIELLNYYSFFFTQHVIGAISLEQTTRLCYIIHFLGYKYNHFKSNVNNKSQLCKVSVRNQQNRL